MAKIHRNALQPGHRVHWYEIVEVLGQGGFGITYLALDTNLQTTVAIKEYLPIELAVREHDQSVHPVSEDRTEGFSWGLEKFITEAQTLAQFKHPNVVHVYAVFEANNTAYMVMQYEEGESLQELLTRRKTVEEAELMKILIPILGGLKLVHEAGFIHRDIKPANIFIRKDGSPVLLDFGSARQALGSRTKTLTTLVSPGYAPFEQYTEKSGRQGPWTDIYGLGATMYRAVCGRPPPDATERSDELLRSSADILVPATDFGETGFSHRFLSAINAALKFRPEERPQSVGEWQNMLAPNLSSERINVAIRPRDDHKDREKTDTEFADAKTKLAPQKSPAAISRHKRALLYAVGGIVGLTWFYWVIASVWFADKGPIASVGLRTGDPVLNPIEGIWTTSFGTMTFGLNDSDEVVGIYSLENGKIVGQFVEESVLSGIFTEEESDTPCMESKNGSHHWGNFEFSFDRHFSEFDGKWGVCGGAMTDVWSGERVR